MKINNKLFGITLAAMAAGGVFVSCTNELNEAAGRVSGIRLAKAPNITAWSGDRYFKTDTSDNYMNIPGSTFTTRDGNADEDGIVTDEENKTWEYDKSRHEDEEWEEFFNFPQDEEALLKKYSDAVNLADPNSDKNNKTIFYIPFGFEGEIDFNFPGGSSLYNYGSPATVGGNLNGAVTFYNAGTFTYIYSSSGGIVLVNTGTLITEHLSNVSTIYNDNKLIIKGDRQTQWNPDTQTNEVTGYSTPQLYSQLSIFSTSGSEVTLPNGVSKVESKLDIHGSLIISEDIVEIQNNHTQYICALIVDDLLKLAEGGIHTSYIKAKTIEFDGAHIWLLPQAYVDAENIKVPNSASEVYNAKDSYAFIKTKNITFTNKNDFDVTYGINIYFSVTGDIRLEGDESDPMTLEEFVSTDRGKQMKYRFELDKLDNEGGDSLCGGYWTFEGGLEDDGEEDFCDVCGHPEHGRPGKDKCPDCTNPEDECYIPETCPECDHKWHGTPGTPTCPECGEGDDCYIPVTQPGVPTTSEVEVNLSINDEHPAYVSEGISDLVAKLSIHVRMGGDVEVFIPIPKEYYVDNDDIVILNNHEFDNFIHGGPTSVEYNVGGTNVSLTLSYENEGIRVTTSGIDSNVLNYCINNFGDGINFEIWLYTNNESGLNFDLFQQMLNRSTVWFIDELPDYYINAFNGTEDNPQGEKDCTVSIIGSQESNFGDGKTDYHLNGSQWNVIYKNNSFEGSEGVHDHGFLWDKFNASHQ